MSYWGAQVMPARTARDVMVPLDDYPHASESQTLREAVRLLETAQIQFGGQTSMPRILLVFDANNQLLGVARRRDILRGLEPDFHGDLDATHPEAHFKPDIDPNLSDLAGGDIGERLEHRLEKPLGDVVRELSGRVNADDSLMKVVRELVGEDSHIAAVLDDDEVIGVVRTLDLLRAICEGHY